MYSTEGIILKRTNVGENDSLFTIYTKDFGKIRAKAQGVKKEGAKLKGHLETLSYTNVSFVIGRNGERLIGAELLNYWPGIRGDYSRVAAGYCIAELVDKNCLNGEKDEALWNFLVQALRDLEDKNFKSDDANEFLSDFEKRFSETQGYSGGENLSAWAISAARPLGL